MIAHFSLRAGGSNEDKVDPGNGLIQVKSTYCLGKVGTYLTWSLPHRSGGSVPEPRLVHCRGCREKSSIRLFVLSIFYYLLCRYSHHGIHRWTL